MEFNVQIFSGLGAAYVFVPPPNAPQANIAPEENCEVSGSSGNGESFGGTIESCCN